MILWSLVTFPTIHIVILPTYLLLPILRSPFFSLVGLLIPYYSPSLLLPNPSNVAVYHFTFLFFVVTIGYLLIFEDLKLVSFNKRTCHVYFFFIWVTSLRMFFSSFIHLSTKYMHNLSVMHLSFTKTFKLFHFLTLGNRVVMNTSEQVPMAYDV